MSAQSYNGELTASRKLTNDEASQLRAIIVKDLNYSPEEQEDVNDLLDYTFAMISNGKSLAYVVQELVSMEMDVCQEATAHEIAMQIAKFLQENVNHVTQEEAVEEEVEEGSAEQQHRVVSLKVRFMYPRL